MKPSAPVGVDSGHPVRLTTQPGPAGYPQVLVVCDEPGCGFVSANVSAELARDEATAHAKSTAA